MSDIVSSVGTVVSVSTSAPATYNSTGFGALTWATCGELAELPSFGAEAALATHTPLATGIVAKRRGSLNYGSVALTMAVSDDDAGQTILQDAAEAAAGADALVSVKVVLVNGEIQYFTAQVMSYKVNVGNADAITMAEVTLEIDNSIIKV
ncbi:MAG: hypothetical protein ACRCVX_09145 [Shewanella sp.]